MQTDEEIIFSHSDFVSSSWRETISSTDNHGYSSLSQSFNKEADTYKEQGEVAKSQVFLLLGKACSPMFNAQSINEPFRPIFQDFQKGMRSAIPSDFTIEELAFFETILDEINEPWLKGRLADILWLCRKPKDHQHARMAIEAYISHPISAETWRKDIDNCWERASRICLQIKDSANLKTIEDLIYSAFQVDYSESLFMPLWLAQLLDRLGIGGGKNENIAQRLFSIAQDHQQKGAFCTARSYLELSAKKYKQVKNEKSWLDSLVLIAECFEQEADSRATGDSSSQMVANSFYENAIQSYRCIPTKNRTEYDVENKLRNLREKLAESGEATLEEMGLIKGPSINIKDMAEGSQAHVSGKQTPEEALMYFSGLYSGPIYDSLKQSAEESISEHPISSLFGAIHMSNDGRVIAKTPALGLSSEDDTNNQAVISQKIHQNFAFELQLTVEGNILPALGQILLEHTITREFLERICHHSPFVPSNREKLTATALWLGFEHDFANAIHLLCPQFENMVRVQLKDAGAHTSNVDMDGIENENGLSTLLDLPEANKVFGIDTTFEIKAIFTDPLGPNLRNETAHGLLDDITALNIGSIYAWWLILRLIIKSLMGLGLTSDNNDSDGDID